MPALNPDIRTGEPVLASNQRDLVREVIRQGKVRGGPGIGVSSGPSGLVISLLAKKSVHIRLGVIVERLGSALDASGRGLGAAVWYKVALFGEKNRAPVTVLPDRILRAFDTDSPARLTPFAVNDPVVVMVVPKRLVNVDEESERYWIVCGERYGTELCGAGGGGAGE